jgi:hypothetical protein
MMADVTPGWRHAATVAEGDSVSLDDMNPWSSHWHPLDEPPIVVPHPTWPSQRHQLRVYELRTPQRTVRFAAGELSGGVWAFFVPE